MHANAQDPQIERSDLLSRLNQLEQENERMRQQLDHQHRLIENFPAGYALCKVLFEDGNPVDILCLEANQAAREVAGLDEMIGRKATEISPRILLADPHLLDPYLDVALTGAPKNFEIQIAPLHAWFSVFLYSPEKEYFVMIFENITPRKQAEETLLASESRWQAVFDRSGLGIGLGDAQGNNLQTNAALQDMLGYSASELSGIMFANVTHPDVLENDLRQFRALLNHEIDMYTMEKRYIRKDKTLIWGSLTLTAVRDAGGNFQMSVALVEDITARKQAEHALMESETRLRAIIDASPCPHGPQRWPPEFHLL